jgi:hypothetical protein
MRMRWAFLLAMLLAAVATGPSCRNAPGEAGEQTPSP